jgi:hypothetical protein
MELAIKSTNMNESTPTSTNKPQKKYVKILHESMVHYGFKYQLGLNVDPIPFNPAGSCKPGGLYFTDLDNFHYQLCYGTLIADVVVPNDTEPCGYIWKASQLIISNIRPISSLPQWQDKKFCLDVIKHYPEALKFVPNELKTYAFYLEAVNENGFAFEFVPDKLKSQELCMIAARQNNDAWMYRLKNFIDV